MTLTPRLGFCRAGFRNPWVRATTNEIDLDLAVTHGFDLPVVSIGLGAGAGLSLLHQWFETGGNAPPRNVLAGHADLVLDLIWDLSRGFYIQTQIAGQLYAFAQRHDGGRITTARFTARPLLLFGKRL